MKHFVSILLIFSMVIGLGTAVFAVPSEEPYGYKTETLVIEGEADTSKIKYELSIPNYLGCIEAEITTTEGSGTFSVAVVYAADNKWDDNCYYNGITAEINKSKYTVFSAYDNILKWNEYYSYGFLPEGGGVYILDSSSLTVNFLNGPGLYTPLSSFYYTLSSTSAKDADSFAQANGFSSAAELAYAKPSMLGVASIGLPFVLVLDDQTISFFLENGTLSNLSSYQWPGLEELLESKRFTKEMQADENLLNFTKKKKYFTGIFTDIGIRNTVPHWYDEFAKTTYELGLIEGIGTKFEGDSPLTVAQAITMAARFNNIYYGGDGTFTQNPDVWYKSYVSYAIKNEIIKENDFAGNYDRMCTRAEMAYIFSNAVPREAISDKNIVSRIPDVAMGDKYSECIFTLYRAGVLTGSDDFHRFYPNSNITRAEASAIISRMAYKDLRLDFSIK